MVVGGYEILREIGHGGMATVYLARQIELDRDVALKELGGAPRPDPTFARRFLREARMAGSLSHPNIVTVYDYFEHDGTPYIAMEYLERGSLRPYVGSLTLAQVGGVLEGMLAGLAHAETRGIVHRDLKPENLMVTGDGAHQDRRLRHRQGARPGRRDAHAAHRDRHHRRHARVHGAGAGDGQGRSGPGPTSTRSA